MALVLKDRVRESTATTGTGTLSLDGAITGFQGFSVIGNTNTTYYAVVDVTTGDWEVGLGTYTSAGSLLSRDTVLESSSGGTKINFGAGPKDVFCTYPAEQAVTLSDIQTLTNKTLSTGTAITAGTINGATIGASTASTGSFTSLTDSGNLAFTGTGNRITGDFSNATLASRVAFQTSTVNGATQIIVFPNGSSTNSGFDCYASSDPTNTSRGLVRIDTAANDFRIQSGITGTGTYLPMTFLTGGSERVRIDTSGNVGIGTNTPGAVAGQTNVEVVGSAGRGNLTLNTTQADGTGVAAGTIAFRGGPSTSGGAEGRIALIGSSTEGATANNRGGFINFNTKANNGTLAEAMRITSAGNVGIGTSSPAVKLHVAGTGTAVQARVQNTGTAADNRAEFRLLSSSSSIGGSVFMTNAAESFYAASALALFNFDNQPIVFGTNNTERMRIDASGNLLVGDTSPIDNSKLLVTQSGDRTAIAISGNSVGGSSHIRNTSAQSSFTAMFMLTSTSTVAGGIFCAGSTTNYATSSDYRLKHDIEPMTGALARVAQLKPVTYKWNADDSDGEGFIAHELQAVVPACVTGEKDGVETYTDEDGVEQTRPRYQGIDTSFLVATLTAAIQELNAKVDAQAAEIAALKGAQ
jgi:hypothetical protein